MHCRHTHQNMEHTVLSYHISTNNNQNKMTHLIMMHAKHYHRQSATMMPVRIQIIFPITTDACSLDVATYQKPIAVKI